MKRIKKGFPQKSALRFPWFFWSCFSPFIGWFDCLYVVFANITQLLTKFMAIHAGLHQIQNNQIAVFPSCQVLQGHQLQYMRYIRRALEQHISF